MVESRVQILIPTCNNVNDLDATMESICKQNFDSESVYVTIVDFGSKDGTYEKAMSYDRYHFGIYSRPFEKSWRLRIANAARLLKYVRPEGLYSFSTVLYPGDVMYPDCLSILSDYYIRNYGLNLATVFCESDILKEDGSVEKQKPLFAENRVIDGSKEINEYVRRGYKHQIFQILPEFSSSRYKGGYELNEGRCFNRLETQCLDRMACYIRQPLACTKRIVYEDELQEILYRWEAIISVERVYSSRWGTGIGNDFVKTASANVAEYALWRSFCLYQRGGGEKTKAVEDCFLISKVIAPGIVSKKIYQDMKRLLAERDPAIEKELEQYFNEQS